MDFQPIIFDVGVNQGGWINSTATSEYRQELTPLERDVYHFDVLILNVINNTDPHSLLHKDTVAWFITLFSRDVNVYFAFACAHFMPMFVMCLWQQYTEMHDVWKPMLHNCIFASNPRLIEFVDSIEPIWVRDNVQTLASNALFTTRKFIIVDFLLAVIE